MLNKISYGIVFQVNFMTRRRKNVLGKHRKEYPCDFVIRMRFNVSILSVFDLKKLHFKSFVILSLLSVMLQLVLNNRLWRQTPPLREFHTDAVGCLTDGKNLGTGMDDGRRFSISFYLLPG